jgi:hypothetical protein
VISGKESRNLLKSEGVEEEIIQTLGHIDDSIILIIDGWSAFIGGLPEFGAHYYYITS